MNEVLSMIMVLSAGLLLGGFFYGGLWWTVRKGVTSKYPATLFLGSLILRTGILLVGFYFVSGGHWKRLAACLLGFVMARLIVTLRLRSRLSPQAPARQAGQAWLTGTSEENHSPKALEASHAP